MNSGAQMRTIFTSIFLLLFAVGLHAQEAAYRYTQGQEYKYLLEQTGMRIQEVQGQTSNISSESTISALLTSLETLENGHQRLQLTVENALMITETPQGSQTTGTDLSGKSIIFEIDATGDVADVDTAIKLLDEEAIGILSGMTNILPKLDASKLSDGSKWEVTRSDTAGEGESRQITESETSYTITGRKEVKGFECFEISIVTNSDIEGKRVQGDNEWSINGEREMKATLYHAIKEGILVSLEAETNGDIVVLISGNNMRIPITSNEVAKITLVP
jgi:hypothetical protein